MTDNNAGVRAARLSCELLKVMRSRWLTRSELEAELTLHEGTVARWVTEYETHGVLVGRPRPKASPHTTGRASIEYSLSPQWGGQGFGSPQDEPDRVAASVGQDTQ